MDNRITVQLPDGTVLLAKPTNDPTYPGIQIAIQKTETEEIDEILCFVEFNSEKPNGEELCICTYTHDEDNRGSESMNV